MNNENKSALIAYIKKYRGKRLDTVCSVYTDVNQIKIKSKSVKNSPTPLRIHKRVIEDLLEAHKILANTSGYWCWSNSSNTVPLIFLLGQKRNAISAIELIRTQGGGCVYMASVYPEDINKASYELIKRGFFPAGIARVGFSESITTNNYTDSFGNGISNLLDGTNEQGIALVSLTRRSFNVKMPNREHSNYVNYSYKIIGERRKNYGDSNN